MTSERRRVEARVRELDLLEGAVTGIEQLDAVDRRLSEDAGDTAVRQKRVPREVEDPLRIAELGLLARERANLSAAFGVEVRPAGPVRDEVQDAVGVPFGLKDRLVLRTGDPAVVRDRPVAGKIANSTAKI